MKTLIRQLKVGQSISFYGGDLVVTLDDRSGRKATLRLQLGSDAVVDKPGDLTKVDTSPRISSPSRELCRG